MNRLRLAMAVCGAALAAMALPAAQGEPSSPQAGGQSPAGAQTAPEGRQNGGRNSGTAGGGPIGGTVMPAKADERGWGWQVKAMMSAATPRPLYNRAKERLLQDKQITSYTISSFDPELYCEVGKHFDYIWFEMQHSTMSYDEVRRMLMACPRVGAAPMIRMPDAFESSIQKATDLGALGIIVPTVDDALEARDAARFSRVSALWTQERRRRRLPGALEWARPELSRHDQRQHARDGDDRNARGRRHGRRDRGHARRRRHRPRNIDLSSFSGSRQDDPRYQDTIVKGARRHAEGAGRYYGMRASRTCRDTR